MSKYPRSIVAYQICLIQIVLYLIVTKPLQSKITLQFMKIVINRCKRYSNIVLLYETET